MPVGTRSILFGAHQFILHPVFMALAWKRWYRKFPRHPAVWIAFIVHDLGYWGLKEMDGEEGIYHPCLGADVLRRLFPGNLPKEYGVGTWWSFVAYHSRSFADLDHQPYSLLMPVDKCATAMYPHWLYWLLCSLSKEWVEYRDRWVQSGTYPGKPTDGCWAWSGYLLTDWQRFLIPGAAAGKSFYALEKEVK